MRKVKEVLRLRFELRFGQRQIARSCRMGLSTVHEYLERAEAAGVGWPLPEDWSEEELEAKLFGQQPVSPRAVKQRPQPDWKTIHEQLQHSSGAAVFGATHGSRGGAGTASQGLSLSEREVDLEKLAGHGSLISTTTRLPAPDP